MKTTTRQPRDVFELIESRMTPARVRRSDAKAAKMLLGQRLGEFRRSLKKQQSAVAGFRQPEISKIEGRSDLRLSTLVQYCRGLGAELTITARASRGGRQESIVLLKA